MKKLGARHWLGLIALALPALLFLPGIGFESSDPVALARSGAGPSTWYYRVQGGDSLTTISERELGTFRRYKEILALNPGIEPRRLPRGELLRMPPRAPATAGGEAPRPGDAADRGPAPASAGDETVAPPTPDARRLLLSLAGLLALVVLIIVVAGRMERRAYYEA